MSKESSNNRPPGPKTYPSKQMKPYQSREETQGFWVGTI
uniref:Uncharacterized protein n=1 Tax=Rhizophora mucronata TaxID=61149 RepID=A0A2P2P9L4_RHIMU